MKINPSKMEGFFISSDPYIILYCCQTLMQQGFCLIKPTYKKQGTSFGIQAGMENYKPRLKDFLQVIFVILVLMAMSYIAYYKFHLFFK